MLIEANSKLVMIGDSVTDMERGRPQGEREAIGKSYVGYVAALLEVVYPERKVRVLNLGTSGNTVRDLKARWQTDVFDLKPDWLSIMIGINDVWRQYDTPLMTDGHVYLNEYAATLEELVKTTLPTVKGMVLMTPYYIETNRDDAMRATMDKYGKVVKEIAEKYNTIFVDTQAVFEEVLKHCHSANIAWDRVHPNNTGHMAIARAFLNAVGFEW